MAIPGISTNDRKRLIVHAEEKLTAFVELNVAIVSLRLLLSPKHSRKRSSCRNEDRYYAQRFHPRIRNGKRNANDLATYEKRRGGNGAGGSRATPAKPVGVRFREKANQSNRIVEQRPAVSSKAEHLVEAGAGIEPANSGFADRDLTTWLPRHLCEE